MYKISKTKEYQEWLEEETFKSQVQIEKRLSNIELEGHFGDHKPVGDEILSCDGRMGAVYITRILKSLILSYYWEAIKMARVKTLHKQKESSKKLKKNKSIIEYSPTDRLLDENFIGKAIMECLINNDPEGVIEIIEMYLDTVNKVQSIRNVQLSRSTLYHTLRGKNPTLRTLAKIVHSSTLPARK